MKMVRQEDEAIQIDLHVHSVQSLLVEDDRLGRSRQEDLLRGGKEGGADAPIAEQPIAEFDAVEFMGVGFPSVLKGIQTLVLDPIDDWAGSHSAEEDFLLVNCPAAVLAEVVWMPASVVLQA